MDPSFLVNPKPHTKKTFALATVAGVSASGVTLKFDGEEAGQKSYKRLASYTSPAQNDRVLVAHIGSSSVVLGKLI
jgi:hypothetical protein